MFRIYLLILYSVCVQSLACIQSLDCGHYRAGFYWRDYDGTIPPDAVPADDDINNPSYIAQVYVHKYGLRVGTIIPGSREVTVSCYGVVKIDIMIKILCADDRSNLIWVRTTAGTFLNDLQGQTPVISGYDKFTVPASGNEGMLYIGRTHQNGHAIIGNVAAYNTEILWFYYPLNGREIVDPQTTPYDVLVYRATPPKRIPPKKVIII